MPDLPEELIEEPADDDIAEPEPEPIIPAPAPKPWHWYLRTNFVLAALTNHNLAVEFDVAYHWSVALEYAHCGWNWGFMERLKFRQLSLRPAVRFWMKPDNHGWFVGAHLAGGYYNVATLGDWRTQDKDGKTPAYGGGFDIGYRKSISKRWNLEFALGVGVYELSYDRFYNIHNGALYDTTLHKIYYGPDNVNIGVSYMLDWKRKKGGKKQ